MLAAAAAPRGGLTTMAEEKEQHEPVVSLVTTRSDAEIAASLKARMLEAMKPVLAIFDEATAAGLIIQWDGLAPEPPFFKHQIQGLRLVKHF
jgi:hypothetical protein